MTSSTFFLRWVGAFLALKVKEGLPVRGSQKRRFVADLNDAVPGVTLRVGSCVAAIAIETGYAHAVVVSATTGTDICHAVVSMLSTIHRRLAVQDAVGHRCAAVSRP